MGDVIRTDADYKKAQDKADIKRARHINMLEQQMQTKPGRQFVWWILYLLGYDQPIVDINAKVYGMNAKQAIAIQIKEELKKASRDEVYLMERENEKEAQ